MADQTRVPNNNQGKFAVELAKKTGLDLGVIFAWLQAEEPTGNSTTREDQNWLNVGQTDSGPTGDSQRAALQSDPVAAADYTAQWMVTKASPGIRHILSFKGKTPAEQIHAIGTSGWATSPNYLSAITSLYHSHPHGAAAGDTIGVQSGALDVLPGGETIKGAFNTAGDLFGLIGQLLTTLVDPTFWLHALEVIAGGVLVFMGLRQLAGNPGPSVSQAARMAL